MNKTIPLSRRYEAHGTAFNTVELRAPKLRDLFSIGEPVEFQPTSGGIVIEHLDRIEAYRDRLLVTPTAADIADLDLVDAMALKDAITGFFTDARKARRQPTSSSGAPDAGSGTSET
jgi:hypothetical protein